MFVFLQQIDWLGFHTVYCIFSYKIRIYTPFILIIRYSLHLFNIEIYFSSKCEKEQDKSNTSHSLSPWNPSRLSSLIATWVVLQPGLTFSSIAPLYTTPKPPSPRIKSGRKRLVAILISSYVKMSTLLYPGLSRKSLTFLGADRVLLVLLSGLDDVVDASPTGYHYFNKK